MSFPKVAAALTLTLGLMAGAPQATAQVQTGPLFSATGHIKLLYVSQKWNLPFRITLDTTLPSCPGQVLYVDDEYENYETYVSGLMLAYSQRQVVAITYAVGTGGYCKIVEYSVTNP